MLSINQLFGKKTNALLGVDISSSGIKVLELSKVGKLIKLQGYACESLPKGAVVNGVVEDVDTVSRTLEKALRRSGCTATNAALAMPNQSVILRNVAFSDHLTDDLIEQQIEADIGEYVPFSIDDIRMDFCRTGKQISEETQEVLIVAAKKELVDGRLSAAESVGLNPVVMDVESYCVQRTVGFMANLLPGAGKDLMLAFVDIGALSLSVTVINGDEVLFEREQAFGGLQLSQDIARTYNLKIEEAEIKKRNGELPPDYGTTLLQPFIENAASAIARSLQFFFTSTPYSRVDQIMLGGGSAVLPGLVDAVVSKTQMPTTLSQPTRGLQLGGMVRERQLQVDAPMLTVAFGLALRGFDE